MHLSDKILNSPSVHTGSRHLSHRWCMRHTVGSSVPVHIFPLTRPQGLSTWSTIICHTFLYKHTTSCPWAGCCEGHQMCNTGSLLLKRCHWGCLRATCWTRTSRFPQPNQHSFLPTLRIRIISPGLQYVSQGTLFWFSGI